MKMGSFVAESSLGSQANDVGRQGSHIVLHLFSQAPGPGAKPQPQALDETKALDVTVLREPPMEMSFLRLHRMVKSQLQ